MQKKQPHPINKDTCDIQVKLVPGSSKEEIVDAEGDVYRVKVTPPPVGGQANKALIAFLSNRLKRPKGSIEIKSGKSSRMKLVRIHGLSKEKAVKRLKGC